jgi:hypothetical protein
MYCRSNLLFARALPHQGHELQLPLLRPYYDCHCHGVACVLKGNLSTLFNVALTGLLLGQVYCWT